MRKIAVVGSRGFADYDLLEETLKPYVPFMLISGGARGADSLAEQFADAHGCQKKIFRVTADDWAKYGKRAGMLRNMLIVKEADEVIAFWDGRSPGTDNTIKLAGQKGLPVRVINYLELVRRDPIKFLGFLAEKEKKSE